MPDADLLPTEAYSWWVPVLGATLLVLVAAWYVFVRWWTDPRRVAGRRDRRAARRAAEQAMSETMRRGYAQRVDVLYDAYRSGEQDLRQLHLGLAATMRDFASERLGTDVRPWTRADVAGYDPTRRLGHLLARWEEPSFAERSDAEAARSAAGAKGVIGQW